MKVEQEVEQFRPITITLETLEEAQMLWCRLNIPDTEVNAFYKEHTSSVPYSDEDSFKLFDRLDDIINKESK